MSGIIFAGCSFTHGHGLWFYNKKLYNKFNSNVVIKDLLNERPIHSMRYKDVLRFPRLVCQELEKFEITRRTFSGNDIDSVNFIDFIFDFTKSNDNWSNEHYKYDEVDYIIFQTSFPNRCGYFINEEDRIFLNFNDPDFVSKMLFNHGFTSIDEFEFKVILQNFKKIKETFIFYENKGIPCFILNLTNDYDNLIHSDEFMSKRKIKIKYEDKIFNNLNDTIKYDHSLIISNDFEYFGQDTPSDEHPSKKFHRIIADNILEKIREFEKNNR